jgi:hypothetical protein
MTFIGKEEQTSPEAVVITRTLAWSVTRLVEISTFGEKSNPNFSSIRSNF